YDEAVAARGREPLLEHVRDLRGAADPGRLQLAAPRDGDEIARRRQSAAAELGQDAVAPGLGAAEAGELGLREGLVERLGAEVEVRVLRQQHERVDLERQLLDERELVLRLGPGCSDDRVTEDG